MRHVRFCLVLLLFRKVSTSLFFCRTALFFVLHACLCNAAVVVIYRTALFFVLHACLCNAAVVVIYRNALISRVPYMFV